MSHKTLLLLSFVFRRPDESTQRRKRTKFCYNSGKPWKREYSKTTAYKMYEKYLEGKDYSIGFAEFRLLYLYEKLPRVTYKEHCMLLKDINELSTVLKKVTPARRHAENRSEIFRAMLTYIASMESLACISYSLLKMLPSCEGAVIGACASKKTKTEGIPNNFFTNAWDRVAPRGFTDWLLDSKCSELCNLELEAESAKELKPLEKYLNESALFDFKIADNWM